jgi:hypothetical protein
LHEEAKPSANFPSKGLTRKVEELIMNTMDPEKGKFLGTYMRLNRWLRYFCLRATLCVPTAIEAKVFYTLTGKDGGSESGNFKMTVMDEVAKFVRTNLRKNGSDFVKQGVQDILKDSVQITLKILDQVPLFASSLKNPLFRGDVQRFLEHKWVEPVCEELFNRSVYASPSRLAIQPHLPDFIRLLGRLIPGGEEESNNFNMSRRDVVATQIEATAHWQSLPEHLKASLKHAGVGYQPATSAAIDKAATNKESKDKDQEKSMAELKAQLKAVSEIVPGKKETPTAPKEFEWLLNDEAHYQQIGYLGPVMNLMSSSNIGYTMATMNKIKGSEADHHNAILLRNARSAVAIYCMQMQMQAPDVLVRFERPEALKLKTSEFIDFVNKSSKGTAPTSPVSDMKEGKVDAATTLFETRYRGLQSPDDIVRKRIEAVRGLNAKVDKALGLVTLLNGLLAERHEEITQKIGELLNESAETSSLKG